MNSGALILVERRVKLHVGANDVAARRIGRSGGTVEGVGRTAESIDQDIKACPQEVQQTPRQLRVDVRKLDPEARKKISWQIPADNLNANVAQFGGIKNNLGLCRRSSKARALEDQLRKNRLAEGLNQFLPGE